MASPTTIEIQDSAPFLVRPLDHGMVQSVGRTGVCWDNSVAELAWSSLKRELVSRDRFDTRAEARRATLAWIKRYNPRRRHSTLGCIAPIDWERQYH